MRFRKHLRRVHVSRAVLSVLVASVVALTATTVTTATAEPGTEPAVGAPRPAGRRGVHPPAGRLDPDRC